MRVSGSLSLTNTATGQAISARRSAGWRHPWTVTPVWRPASRQWIATVKPGLVNGTAPIVRTTIREQQQRGDASFGVNPLSGELYFSASVFDDERSTATGPTRVIDVPLYHAPALALEWRRVGWDGAGAVPQFFKDRGAGDAAPVPTADDLETGAIASGPRRPARLLRACDVILHQPRAALTSDISLQPGPVTGISNVTQTLGLRSAPAGDVLRVFAGDFTPTAGIDPLARDYEEATWDELLIATVFLLSPIGAADGSAPDGRWTPFVRHELFWNLSYVRTRFRPVTTAAGTPFIPPLAGGAAQLVINFLTASINDLTQNALNVLGAHSLAGRWFTATGGGQTSEFPPEPEVATPGGLGRDARVTAQRLAASRAQRAAQLDPAFPYRAVQFDPGLLTA